MIDLILDQRTYATLHEHLFQPDHDEHAAVVLAGVHQQGDSTRLLGRELHLVPAEAFPPGQYGYRQTNARTVAELASRAADQRLAYIALHSHPGATTSVALSQPDLAGHQRLFPHLYDLTDAPVSGVALGEKSAHGEVWLTPQETRPLDRVRILGEQLQTLTALPSAATRSDARYDRQARMFGDAGQERLRTSHVAVIGAGGGGSILVEQLAHLGVGALTIVDYDTVGPENLSRIVGANASDARQRHKKVDVLARLVARIAPDCRCIPIDGDLNDLAVAEAVLECDFLFLATDTISSRLIFNAIVHRYLIPGVQIGAKIEVRPDGGVADVYVAVRPVWPHIGCLACSNLIPSHAIQREQRTNEEAQAQNYLDEPAVIDPSVITLNAIGASHASTLYLLASTGLAKEETLHHRLYFPARGETLDIQPKRQEDCFFCSQSPNSMYARGGRATELPVRRTVSASSGPRRRGWWSWLRRRPQHAPGRTRQQTQPRKEPT